MKTLKVWEQSDLNLDVFLSVGDEIDEVLYNYFGEVVVPQYVSEKFIQLGEPEHEEEGIDFFMSACYTGKKYIYLGILPEFKQ